MAGTRVAAMQGRAALPLLLLVATAGVLSAAASRQGLQQHHEHRWHLTGGRHHVWAWDALHSQLSAGDPHTSASAADAAGLSPGQSVFAAPGIMTKIAVMCQEGLTARFQKQPKPGQGRKPRPDAVVPFPYVKLLDRQEVWSARQRAVVRATQETWAVYEKYAFGKDELLPLTRTGRDNWGGMGMMILDSLDTLYLMGLFGEFDRSLAWVADHLDFDNVRGNVSLFETTIRALGGLLSAHDLSGEEVLLQRAGQLAAKLLPAFHGGAFPGNTVDLGKAEQEEQPIVALSQFGTLGLELAALGARAGVTELAALAQIPFRVLYEHYPDRGLLPSLFIRSSGFLKEDGNSELSIAGMQDSYYEYLLKMWLLTQEPLFRDMWVRAMDEALEKLVGEAPGGELLIGRWTDGSFNPHMDHLACWLPGSLALGVHAQAVGGDKAAAFLAAARSLTDACWLLYRRTATGLSGEGVVAIGGLQMNNPSNKLRPEVVESLWYLWRATGDERYRDWGWEAFNAFLQHSRTAQGAFAKIANVNAEPAIQHNEMATYWTAETLKYFWLLFGDGSEPTANLTQWVFSTEAHPIRVHPGDNIRQDLAPSRAHGGSV